MLPVPCGKNPSTRLQHSKIVSGGNPRSAQLSIWFVIPGFSFLFRLVILDYLMLNANHGLDNPMIKCCDIDYEKASIDTPPVKASNRCDA
jgi:hypothetical protein